MTVETKQGEATWKMAVVAEPELTNAELVVSVGRVVVDDEEAFHVLTTFRAPRESGREGVNHG